jgi:hypothetical protein
MKYHGSYHKVQCAPLKKEGGMMGEKYEVEGGVAMERLEMFKVEQGIPIPSKVGRVRRRVCPYPYNKMKLGDSFFVPCSGKELRERQVNVADWRRRYFKLMGIETHKVKGGLRVWRVK